MHFILIPVLIIVLGAAVLNGCRYLWGQRTQLVRIAIGPVQRRRERRGNRRRASRIEQVLQNAREGDDVPVAIRGNNPAVVSYHPTGRVELLYRDLPTYLAAGRRGEHGGYNAHVGRAPLPIARWTDDELQSWLEVRAIVSPKKARQRARQMTRLAHRIAPTRWRLRLSMILRRD